MSRAADTPPADDLHRQAACDLAGPATEELVARYAGLARSLALRFARHQHDADDLVQVAMFGLLQALRRFDPDRGFEFSTFAHATITGELKRYRRRTGWALHVPRRLQEAYLAVAAAAEELGQELHRPPTVGELADRTGLAHEDVLECLELREAQHPSSLDGSVAPDGGGHPEPGVVDTGYAGVERADLVAHLLERLNERERQIVRLRFFDNLSQREIADRVGISQMHVSRVLRLALEKLRVLADR